MGDKDFIIVKAGNAPFVIITFFMGLLQGSTIPLTIPRFTVLYSLILLSESN